MYEKAKSSICVILIIKLLDSCEGLKISYFHDFCNRTIYDEAGELRFDARKLPSDLYGNICNVTVQPKSEVLGEKTQTLFYFPKFSLEGTCKDMNVTVLDGPLFNRTRVQGLPTYICGYRRFLGADDKVFTTSSNQFTVTFNRKDFTQHATGNFSIKFMAFHTGKCEGSGVVNCSNGRCIAMEYVCADDINSCGLRQTECDFLKVITKVFETILKYSWIVLVLIVLFVLKCIYKRHRKTIIKSKLCSDLRELVLNCHTYTCRRSSDNSVPLQNDPNVQLLRVTRNARETVDETLSVINSRQTSIHLITNRLSDIEQSPGYEDHVHISNVEHILYDPSTPPPSYEEVVVPSYEEVIRNKHKYKMTL